MAATTKRGSKTTKAKQRRPKLKTSVAEEAQTNAELHQQLAESFQRERAAASENVRLSNALNEALEQQTATSEILGVIASSPTDIQPVFQTILANAIRLCEAKNGVVFRFDGQVFRTVVRRDVSPALRAYVENMPLRPGRESAVRRVGLEKRPVHIPDILADPECVVPEAYKEEGMRTSLAVNLLKESLEQQTATSEILGVIASSPTDIQPVLDTIARNAASVSGSYDAMI